jgi:hypothetical protein
MQELINQTPYAIAVVPFIRKDGRGMAATIVKGTFDLYEGSETPTLADEQVPIVYADDYFQEGEKPSSIRYAGEAVPLKPGTDVAVVGYAYPPRGVAKSLDVLLRVGPLQQTLRVFGDRVWHRSLGHWKISTPRPFDRMPLRYERAFGGQGPLNGDPGRQVRDPRNPIGRGFAVAGDKNDLEGLNLPNVEHPAALINSWKDRPPVAGFGFIDGSWEPRVRYAGTYDRHWEKTRSPLLPADFDERFHNAAHPNLVVVPYLSGGEPFRLIHAAKTGDLKFNLPRKQIHATVQMRDQVRHHPAVLDTVVVVPDAQRLLLTWRATFDCDIDVTTIDRVTVGEKTMA